jgi:serine protease Do
MALLLAMASAALVGAVAAVGLSESRRVSAWPSYAALFEAAAPSVVSVAVERPEARSGSGFAVSADEVVTARHLVVGAPSVEVIDVSGAAHPAELVGSDARSDLALLRVQGARLVPAPLGDSSRLRVGDAVVAIGNPYGLGHSLSAGVVGHVGRRLASGDDGPRVDFVQLSVPLNPGNSGGPVYDARGDVVGVLSGTHAQGQAIAFAVPVQVLLDALPALRAGQHVSRAFLGLRLGDGAAVASVIPHSPADRAGVRVGDRLVSLGERPVAGAEALQGALDALAGGQEVTLVLQRDDEPLQLEVKLADWARQPVVAAGMTLVPAPGSGGEVVAVRPRSRAERAGMQVGDRVRAVDGVPVRAPADIKGRLAVGDAVQLEVLRGGAPLAVALEEAGEG